ncbi:MAG: hypothetical protein K2M03_07600 [Muribaculaceae bacterium]|nr:hypothetical protein [Muribaculaceae bacterium]
MKAIGGYFELELSRRNDNPPGHQGIYLNSGRHAFEYILRNIGKVSQVYLPRYTCDVMLQPLNRLGINYTFYDVNRQLKLDNLPVLADTEYIVINNYFGIQDSYVADLASHYKQQAIIDNAQAWYAPALPGIKALYSPRKFFGLPDGGIAVNVPDNTDILPQDKSYDRFAHLLKRHELSPSEGYADFKTNSAKLSELPLMEMSPLTRALMANIDYDSPRDIRRRNFEYLHNSLKTSNLLEIPDIDSFSAPMVYPYLISEGENLRHKLIENEIFVATYWPNVPEWSEPGSDATYLTRHLLPLPIDQRYDISDMQRILSVINSILN